MTTTLQQIPLIGVDANGEIHPRPRLPSGEPVPEVIDQSKVRTVGKDHPLLQEPDVYALSPAEAADLLERRRRIQADLDLAEDQRLAEMEQGDANEDDGA